MNASVAHVDEGLTAPCQACGQPLFVADGGAKPCSECGVPAVVSLDVRALAEGNPTWITTVSRGMVLIGIGLIAMIFVLLPGSMVLGALSQGQIIGTSAFWVVSLGISMVCAAIYVIGVWLATSIEPALSADEPTWTARRIARFALIADLIAAPLYSISDSPLGQAVPSSALLGVLITSTIIVTSCSLVGWVALGMHMQRHARRVGRTTAGVVIRISTVLFGLAALVSGGVGLVVATQMQAITTGQMSLATLFALLSVCGAVGIYGLTGILIGVLMFVLASSWRRARRSAQKRWNDLLSGTSADGEDAILSA